MTQTQGIVARDVTVTYRNGHTALKNATFDIPTGTITALVGVNGAGKSTLFKAIMGFVPAAKGDISVLGLPVKSALRRNIVAYVPQSEDVDWSFPVLVEDVVMMGRYGHMGFLRRPSPADEDAAAAALDRAPQEPHMAVTPHHHDIFDQHRKAPVHILGLRDIRHDVPAQRRLDRQTQHR
ncbi:MAG: ATP-binding cassette domain-containing protein, partial [Pseudomonadota bacterium]